ncbi:MAG TPA: LytR C-terminal domain-containing protein [Candidatus Saccharimonadales bacterium]|jgi:hypothetical protein
MVKNPKSNFKKSTRRKQSDATSVQSLDNSSYKSTSMPTVAPLMPPASKTAPEVELVTSHDAEQAASIDSQQLDINNAAPETELDSSTTVPGIYTGSTAAVQAKPVSGDSKSIDSNDTTDDLFVGLNKSTDNASRPLHDKPKQSQSHSETDTLESSRVQPPLQKHKILKVTRTRLIVASFVLLVGVLGLVWAYQARSTDDTTSAANKALVAEVAERAVLPQGETPTITTVVDKKKINQTFLANAADGDKVLLYFQSGQAIVYRPSTRQIVNMGPLAQPAAEVFVRNGSSKNVPSSVSDKLNQAAGFTIVSRDTSNKRDYPKTLVIDIAGNRPDVAKRTAELIGGEVAQLPAGENRPDADILIIIGANAQ